MATTLDVLSGTPQASGLVRVQGPMTIIADPGAGGVSNGNLTIANNLTVSGSISAVSGVQGNLTVSGSLGVLSGASVTGGIQFDQVNGGPASATTISQLISVASSTITMTGSGRVIYLNPTSTQSTALLTPTGSASATAFTYTNGMEVTLVNINPVSASTITIPSLSAGAAAVTPVVISGGQTARLMYVAALQSWLLV
jgi:hypothetical protein